jgi:DNA modification methylase
MSVSLYQGDCLEIMPTLRASSVDMVLCDLPYGTTRNKWDSVLPLPALWGAYARLAKKAAALLFTAQTPFDKVLGASNLSALRYEWVWQKNVATGFLNAKKMPLKCHENVLVFYAELPTYNPQFTPGKSYVQKRSGRDDTGENYGTIKERTDTVSDGKRYPKTVIAFNREIGLYPTQKPVALMEYLIRTYTNPGDTVLDNCMGSGTTGVACVNTGRSFIGIEKDPGYFTAASARIAAAQKEVTI